MAQYFIPGVGVINDTGSGDEFLIPGGGIFNSATGAVNYDDGAPSGGIVFGGPITETTGINQIEVVSSGGFVFGGGEISTPELHQDEGTTSGGIVFGGNIVGNESWTNVYLDCVAVKGGTYRIDNTIYVLENTLYYPGLGDIAALVSLNSSPATYAYFRYDLIVVDSSKSITSVQGTSSTTPVMPDTPEDHVLLNYVLRYYGQMKIEQKDIGKVYTTPVLSSMSATIASSSMSTPHYWQYVDIYFYNQYGIEYRETKTINHEFLTGNGTVTPSVKSGTGASFRFTYTRDDESPIIKFYSETGIETQVVIMVLDGAGIPLWS